MGRPSSSMGRSACGENAEDTEPRASSAKSATGLAVATVWVDSASAMVHAEVAMRVSGRTMCLSSYWSDCSAGLRYLYLELVCEIGNRSFYGVSDHMSLKGLLK